MSERWAPVPGYGGAYSVSTHGRVRSNPRPLTRGRTGSYIAPPLIMKPYRSKTGYLTFNLSKDGRHRTFLGHALVAMAWIPNPHGLRCVNHINGDKADNRVENLERCDHSHNNRHAYRTGLRVMTDRQREAARLVGLSNATRPRKDGKFAIATHQGDTQ
jgi:hypothetical protein